MIKKQYSNVDVVTMAKTRIKNIFKTASRIELSVSGGRASESVQRSMNLANIKTSQGKMFPIYDWTDKDVWMYIRDNNLEFPDAYKFMYQVGIPINRLRISQFFSIDTIRSLVNMCEFYPGLFDKICKR